MEIWNAHRELEPVVRAGRQPATDPEKTLEALCDYAAKLERKVLDLTLKGK